MITYRWVIYTDSVRECRIGACSSSERREFKRASKDALRIVTEAFEKALWHNVPDGSQARAWLEVVDSHGYSKRLVQYAPGRVIALGDTGAATKAEWIRADDLQVIRAGVSLQCGR